MNSKVMVATAFLGAAAFLIPVISMAQEDLSATGSEVAPAARVAAMSSEDSEFLAKAVKVSSREVADADMALHNSQRDEVKTTARNIASAHTKARVQIDALARRRGMSLSDETMSLPATEAHSDAAMVAALLKAHEDAVASFHRESIRGTDPEVRKFAEDALPSLQRNLASLRTLQTRLPAESI